MFIFKTGFLYSIPYHGFTTPDSPLCSRKDIKINMTIVLELLSRIGFPVEDNPKNATTVFPLRVFQVSLLYSISFVFKPYHPQNDDVAIFDRIVGNIYHILSDYPSVTNHMCGYFNIYHKESSQT